MEEQDINLPPDDSDDEKNPIETHTSTTFDVSSEAAEALRRFNAEKANKNKSDYHYPVIDGDKVTVKIEVKGATTPLLLTVTDDAVIGRRDPTSHSSPELDLTPYGGYQMGISRRHAVLRLADNHLEVIDLGSRNGTFLDGIRLKAHQPTRLHDSSELRLGKIVLMLKIHQA